MDIQNIDLRRGDFEGMHPKAKLFGFDEDKKLYTGDGVESINDQWTTWCACIGMLFLDGKEAQAAPEWAVIVPRLSANYLFNKVPELGFKHQDEKDTVLYHLNYMASGFKESAKQLVEDNHAKQKAMIKAQEPAND
ncbi:hypothetical protein [Acinetobacter indicus]|uniref:hypothetical protein n=1 Tax=Acinetobacter indicus TaxID=756892 RepID=UPI0032B3C124